MFSQQQQQNRRGVKPPPTGEEEGLTSLKELQDVFIDFKFQ